MKGDKMKEIGSWRCFGNDGKIFDLRICENSDEGLVGRLREIRGFMKQCTDFDSDPELEKNHLVGTIEGADVEEITGNATVKLNELGHTKIKWRKEAGC